MISARRASMESVDGSGTSGENAACGAALREIHPWPVPLEGPAHAEFSPCGGGSILLTGVNSKVPSISYAENGALGCDVQ